MSKSMAVAIMALFFSLTGWGVAAKVVLAPPNTVGTQQIVNKSIRLADMHPSATRALKGRRGDTGATGAAGAAGSTGATGATGAAGAAGGFDPARVTYVWGPLVNVAAGASGSSDANCPAGTVAIGGGGTGGAQTAISAATANRSAWRLVVFNDLGFSFQIAAFAVCAGP